jgi:hypothetical protein
VVSAVAERLGDEDWIKIDWPGKRCGHVQQQVNHISAGAISRSLSGGDYFRARPHLRADRAYEWSGAGLPSTEKSELTIAIADLNAELASLQAFGKGSRIRQRSASNRSAL